LVAAGTGNVPWIINDKASEETLAFSVKLPVYPLNSQGEVQSCASCPLAFSSFFLSTHGLRLYANLGKKKAAPKLMHENSDQDMNGYNDILHTMRSSMYIYNLSLNKNLCKKKKISI
jgi:hypothetical protein